MKVQSADRRLGSWKEIASFFGKDERTVKRWEVQRGLPVHRAPGGNRTTVYAYVQELEGWLRGHDASLPVETPIAEAPAPPKSGTSRHLPFIMALAALVLVIGATAGLQRTGILPFIEATDDPPTEPLAPSIHDLYLSGLYNLSTRTPEGLTRAVEQFTQIIARDPNHAGAYAQLANAYNLLTQYALMPADIAYPQAKAAAERAILLDPKLAVGYSALAFTEFYWSRDFAHSQELFETALKLDPQSSQVYSWYALTIMHAGKFAEALKAIDRAQELDPESRAILANKALITFHAGNTREAVAMLLDLRPGPRRHAFLPGDDLSRSGEIRGLFA